MSQNDQPPVGWFMKFIRFPPVRIFAGSALIIAVPTLVQLGIMSIMGGETPLGNVIAALLGSAGVLLTYYGFVRLVERRRVSELDTSLALKELGAGALLGALLFSVTIGIIWMLGYYQVSGTNPWQTMLPWLIIGIISGTFEEVLARGILFRIMEESLGTWIALAASALIFGALHLANPNATLWAGLAIAIEAGILLAATYMYTRRLWIPIGLHFAWNFVQGGIFGVSVSGIESEGLLQASLHGPALLSGGEFGAEASIFAVIVCLSAGVYFLRKSYVQGRFVRPFWSR